MRLGTGLLTCAVLLAAATLVDKARASGVATYFAIIAPNGATVTGSGVTTSTRTAVGTYEVKFGRSIANCALIATLRGSRPGSIVTAPDNTNPLVAKVGTFVSGTKANHPFYLLVYCNS
jgi:hypothetical protein